MVRLGLLGAQPRELGPLIGRLELGDQLDHAAVGAAGDARALAQIDLGVRRVVVGHQTRALDDAALRPQLLDHGVSAARRDGVRCDRVEARLVVDEHHLVDAVFVLEVIRDAVVLTEPRDEREVGLLVLDDELPNGVRAGDVEHHVGARREADPAELLGDDLRDRHPQEHLVDLDQGKGVRAGHEAHAERAGLGLLVGPRIDRLVDLADHPVQLADGLPVLLEHEGGSAAQRFPHGVAERGQGRAQAADLDHVEVEPEEPHQALLPLELGDLEG